MRNKKFDNIPHNVPKSINDWILDIIPAYKIASEAVKMIEIHNDGTTNENLVVIAADICIEARKLKKSKINRDKASDAALCSYVAIKDNFDDFSDNKILVFSFAYLAAHFGLNIISLKEASKLMNDIENNIDVIKKKI